MRKLHILTLHFEHLDQEKLLCILALVSYRKIHKARKSEKKTETHL